ncbi:MAG: tetratricopeptide repeat protein [Candidatus Eisenbacteria bacterium]|nr:tetratricopeptide repeat protein [Candidatus Eisenbacteria bacterium]
MSSSFSTTPNDDRAGARSPESPGRRPTHRRTAITWGLLALWALLIAFGIVGQFDPPWLRALSHHGRTIEVSDIKNFGDDAFRRGAYRQAIEQYERALEIDPERVSVILNLGVSYVRLGRLQRGAELLRDALARAESEVSIGLIHFALGHMAEDRGDREEALEHYRASVAQGSELDKRYVQMGKLYLEMEEFTRARDAFQHALDARLDIRRSYLEMLYRARDAFEDDSTELAIIEAQIADPPTREEMQRYDLDTIRQLLQTDREIAVLHNYLGWANVRLQQFAQATRHFEESLRIWPRGNRNATENLRVLRQIQSDSAHGAPAP